MVTREDRRHEMQLALDSQKTQLERNELGQFSTPYPLALDMVRYARHLIGKNGVSMIEPSIGTGVFYEAFSNEFGPSAKRALGFEIDPHYYEPARKFWEGEHLEMRLGDFLEQAADEAFDMLVANPPYVRHHHIGSVQKQRLQQRVLTETGIRISGLAGLYCYFMMLSSGWLREGGVSCWLVPSEFMDVNYGQAVKQYLLENVTLLHIHRFQADDLQFADALVSSCIVVFRNEKPTGKDNVRFSIGGSINHPDRVKVLSSADLTSEMKWTPLFTEDIQQKTQGKTLGDFFMVKRGIATGDNSFFVVDKEKARRYHIPETFLRPMLPSPKNVQGDVVENADDQEYLFTCHLPETVLKEEYPGTWKYIEEGRKRGVADGYICKNRSLWYSLEERKPSYIVMPYMGRSESSNRMFRFILNTSGAITTNVYLLLYPKPQYEKGLRNEQVLMQVWQALNKIPSDVLARGGRFYGGGLRKIEPRELMKIPVGTIENILAPHEEYQQQRLFA